MATSQMAQGGTGGSGGTHVHMRQMLQTHPKPGQMFDQNALVECIEACSDCAQVCTSCADACLAEDMVKDLVRCIRLNLDCADICDTTGRVLARQTEPDMQILQAQLQACRACGAECQKHASHMNMKHCAVCADACHRCEQACNRLLGMAA